MPVDTQAKRMAVAHIKRLGKGVFPSTTGTVLGRSAIAWNYVTAEPTPPVGGAGPSDVGIGQKKTFSTFAELGGGSW